MNDEKVLVYLSWLWSATATFDLAMSLYADSIDERIFIIVLGSIFAGGAIGFFLAYRKSHEQNKQEVAYTVEQMLEVMKMRMEEMMRQNVHRENQETLETKYEELKFLYGRMTSRCTEMAKIIEEKEQYIKNLNDIIDAKNKYIKGLKKTVAVPEQYIKDAEDLGATDK